MVERTGIDLMAFKALFKDLRWIAPLSLGLGALLEWGTSLTVTGGQWWIGWLAYVFLFCVGLMTLTTLWRRSGADRTLTWALIVSVVLRLGLGVALTFLLPATGYGTPSEQAGYLFPDAFLRDTQAWNLASSGDSLWLAFDKSYSADQYGGLLFLISLLYRCLSLDAHRPWLAILLAAFVYGIGVLFGWRIGNILLGRRGAALTVWILALYPESILTGSSQMREPFLIAFTALFFWGILTWTTEHSRRAFASLLVGLTGLLLFSPGVALAALCLAAGWLGALHKDGRPSHRLVLFWVGALLMAVLLFWLVVSRSPSVRAGILEAIADWFQLSAKYDVHFIERSSGWIQRIFEELPPSLHMPFMTSYGIAQPVLPAILTVALFPGEEMNWTLTVLGIFRALGWYILAPFLLGGILTARAAPQGKERFAWLWTWGIMALWVILSSYRAGGDQWDNPRYRSILLLWQALLAARAWLWWRETHDRWMKRILAAEGIFLVLFLYWYLARYSGWRQGQVHVFVILLLLFILTIVLMASAWLRDRLRQRQLRYGSTKVRKPASRSRNSDKI